MSESSHTQLFTFLERQPDALRARPLLARMQNFYTDCQFEPGELQPLLRELTSVLQFLNPRTQLFLIVQEFHTFCVHAQTQGEPVLGCCD